MYVYIKTHTTAINTNNHVNSYIIFKFNNINIGSGVFNIPTTEFENGSLN